MVFLSDTSALDADMLCNPITKGQPHMPSADSRSVTTKQLTVLKKQDLQRAASSK